ncbi:Transcription factor MADS-box [Arabidopsis thaliana x Arabidopsis arenosa]|uniref:Transcription factor MADS-box n=1 Tax=Arabidopsis thaliana x Arabidopsis arenosa TaxID=1240361 RepID=A0A8T1Z0H7_9BRAS|nr:Transcription factor MADS-box [Arabidopsis thaliana x Arabidopsis arenosa]
MPSSSVVDSTMKKGTKRKIEIKKRETKQQRAVTCSKRRQTVFSKAADLCLLAGANVAVFVTSPSDSSDVVYSFSGYSPAYEIADCYLNEKPPPTIVNPQSKLGFWWEDPDLYHSCDDLSELNIIEDRLQRMKKHVMACLEKIEKSQLVSSFDQNPSSACSLDEDCGGSSSDFCPNPSSSDHESCSDQTLASFHGDQNPNSSPQSSSQIVSFDQNSYSALNQTYGESSSQVACFDPNPSFEIQGCETEEENNQINLLQETQTEATVNLYGESFWDSLFKDDDGFGLNSDFCLDSTNDLIDLGEFNEEELEYLDFSQFTY